MTEPRRANRGPILLALLLTALVVGIGGISAQRRIASFQPLGFAAEARAGHWLVTSAESAALEPGDQILLVNGESFGRVDELAAALRRQASSELLVLRGGQMETVSYALPPLRIDYPYLILAVIGGLYLLIGFYTLLRDRRRPSMLFYAWCLTSAAVYLVSSTPPFDLAGKSAYLLEELARILLAPLTLHLFTVFPRPLARGDRLRRVVPFFYLPGAFLVLLQADLVFFDGTLLLGGGAAAVLPIVDRLELAHLAIFGLVAAAVLLWRLRHTEEWEAQRQATWIAIGMVGGYLPFLCLYVLPALLGFPWPTPVASLAVLPLALVPLTFAYAILRYKLWDIGVIVRGAASLSLTVILGVTGFAAANLAISRAVPTDMVLGRSLLTFVSGLMIAGLLVPTRRGIGGALERLQYRGTFGRRRALAEFGREVLRERNLERLCRSLAQQLELCLDLRRIDLFIAHGSELMPVRGRGGGDATLRLEAFEEDFWDQEVEILHGIEFPTAEVTVLHRLYTVGYRYVFPLKVREKILGFVATGYREDDLPLSSDDFDLVRNLLNQAALAIENAQLLNQVERQLEEARRLKRYNEGIVESSPAGIAVLDAEGRVLSANLAFAYITGAASARIDGQPLRELLPIEPLPKPEEGIQEASFADRDGRQRYVQISVAPLDREAGLGLRVLVIQDVSERVAMLNELKEKDRLASLGMLAAGVAHEVNTPITGISSYAQMLLADTPATDPRHELLRKMERQTFRAAQIVNNLLEFARNREPERHSVSLGQVIADVLDLLAERIAENRVEVDFQPPAREVLVTGNEGELQQVFTNLIMNSLEAMGRDGGTLTLRAECDERWAWASVADTGPGISPRKLDKIFQPFFSSKLETGGTGLGLAITYNIVRRHGGDIRVISHPGEGARFLVELPLRPEKSRESTG